MLAITPKHHQIAGQDFHLRDYFVGAMRSKDYEVYTSKPYRSANDNLWKFSLATPVTLDNERYVLGASIATDSTRAIEREENLMRAMFRWTFVALTPSAALATWFLGTVVLGFFRRRLTSGPSGSVIT
jgi:hypothetical protein